MLVAESSAAVAPECAYRAGDFLLTTPGGVLVADGPGAALDLPAARAALARPDAVVVGALPFRPDVPARLMVPSAVHRRPPLTLSAAPAGGRWSVRHDGAAAYVEAVRRALTSIAAGAVDKVVLARCLDLVADDPVDVGRLVAALSARDPHGYTFATGAGGRTLVGTSPELLVSRRGDRVTSNPLAGSRPRGTDPATDGRNATQLLRSAKDRREHAMVVTAVADALAPLCRDLVVPADPELLPTRSMWHLSTRVTGTVRDRDATALDLAVALHPTPAVCGTPAAAARALIGELEPFDRGCYTGAVGWTDHRGDGEWVVAIRCGEVDGTAVRLFAGAGVVAGSVPEAELAETTAKFATLLGALGLEERQ
ncbi:isochorismate synthase MenF [Lentzea sp. NPDC058450]|uniref:isochorismate synthase n=1 Tax=Lentzea sp. NPDC058450 TaxID=3346505 RepID=UPI003656596C